PRLHTLSLHDALPILTAILAQAQAGRRMLGQDNTAVLAPVLDDTVTQARRASAILERFRNWSRPQKAARSAFDLRDALKNVETQDRKSTRLNSSHVKI